MTTRPSPELAARVCSRAAAERERLVELCGVLVAAPSVNPPGDTRAAADVVAAALRERGLPATVHFQNPTMPSVLTELDSGRPGPHLILNVHLDTMPPGDESAWTVPVWTLTRSGGRLYGLGMGNMKGAVAAMVTAMAILRDMTPAWVGRITFAAVSDEVVFGDNGAAFLLREHPDLYADALICGEGPGFRRLAVGEKGVLWLRIGASGRHGHASAVKPAESAAARIAAAVCRIDALTGSAGRLPAELRDLGSDDGLTLSANVGTISAGTFIGQIATTATAEVDLRLPPGISQADALGAVHRSLAGIDGLTVDVIKGWEANWTAPTSELASAWGHACVAVTGEAPAYAIRLPASDASRWRRADRPALCYGPQPTFSAGLDDYADEDEVVRCVGLYTLAALAYLGERP